MDIITILFMLLASHAVCDYALQNDFVAQAKNHTTTLGKTYWTWVLPAHGIIHGLGVLLATGSVIFAIFETVVHSVIDYLKCDNRIGFHTDQWLHVLCKVGYVLVIVFFGPVR